MSAKITIAIPFYRGLELLRRAIQSVLAQSESAWELWILDDGGLDDVETLLQQLADPRIRFERNLTNLGMAGNWNRCLEIGTAPFVQLLHADDELMPTYVTEMLRVAEEHPEGAIYFCQAQIIDAASKPTFSLVDQLKRFVTPAGTVDLKGEAGLTQLLRGNFLMCPTILYRREAITNCRFDPRWKFVLDWEFTTRLLLQGKTLIGMRDKWFRYRRHQENATVGYSAGLLRYEEEYRFLNQRVEDCQELDWKHAARTAKRKTSVRLYLILRILIDLLSLRFKSAGQKLRFLLMN
jgi:glycosyltransferase involved in cell wall biosynthesis